MINAETNVPNPFPFEIPSPHPFAFKPPNLAPFQRSKPIPFELLKGSPLVNAKKVALVPPQCKYKIITKYYPSKLLKVKEKNSIQFFNQNELLKALFLLFLLFILFFFIKKIIKRFVANQVI